MTISETLEYELKKYVGGALPAHATADLHTALA